MAEMNHTHLGKKKFLGIQSRRLLISFKNFIFQVLQEDLEQEQVRVNSLTHMVVVVDESSGDHATAALEEQLKVRLFSLICHSK